MIVVDSSVWINNLRGVQSSGVETFNAVQAEGLVLLGDLILLEILQGARSNENASRLERLLRTYPQIIGHSAAKALLFAKQSMSSLAPIVSFTAMPCCMRIAISSQWSATST
jgi:predicted nucleic acid-binding protein